MFFIHYYFIDIHLQTFAEIVLKDVGDQSH